MRVGITADGAAAELRGVGEVFDGELSVALGDVVIPRGPEGFERVPRVMRAVELRGELTEDAMVAVLSGWAPLEPYFDQLRDNGTAERLAEYGEGLRSLLGREPHEETPEERLRSLLEAVADIDPSPDDVFICRGLSVGYRLEASSRAP